MVDDSQALGSILAIDFGSVNTRAVLFDQVDGAYHLVAFGHSQTTTTTPLDDVHIAVERILHDISRSTGHRLLNDYGQIIQPEQINRAGVDYVITTASAGRPLRAVVVGLVQDMSLASALRAISSAYIEPIAEIHITDGLSEQDRINTIILNYPDIIFIAGGTDGGAQDVVEDLLKLVALSVHLMPESNRPTVIYAGNQQLATRTKDLLSELTHVLISPNVRPTEDEEAIEPAQIIIGQAYDTFKAQRDYSYRNIASMTSSGILPTAQSVAILTAFYAQSTDSNTLTIDLGSASTLLSMSTNTRMYSTTRTDIGIGHSATSLVHVVGEAAIAAWLPFYLQPDELYTYALNKTLRPATIPMDTRELYIEHAMARAAIQHITSTLATDDADLQAIDLIIGAGATLTATGHPTLTMLLLVDALQPAGVTHIKADPRAIIPALGALALRDPSAVVQLTDNNVLEHIGTVVRLFGTPSTDTWAMRLTITAEDGQTFKHDINGGDMWVFPLPNIIWAEVHIELAHGLSIDNKTTLDLKLYGGTGGILFDARGHTATMRTTVAERASTMPKWFAQVTGRHIQAIPSSWVAAPELEDNTTSILPTNFQDDDFNEIGTYRQV
jgi:uncharacterized protein (TIGR01319 family)